MPAAMKPRRPEVNPPEVHGTHAESTEIAEDRGQAAAAGGSFAGENSRADFAGESGFVGAVTGR